MATEDDKTNTGVAGTAIAIGVAAMIAGSSALVGMARTQIGEVSQGAQAYADLNSVKALNSEQHGKLNGAKVSIDKARQLTVAALKGDPEQASPWTPKSAAVPAASTTEGTEAAPSASGEPAASAPSGSTSAEAAPAGITSTEAAPSAAPSAAPAGDDSP